MAVKPVSYFELVFNINADSAEKASQLERLVRLAFQLKLLTVNRADHREQELLRKPLDLLLTKDDS